MQEKSTQILSAANNYRTRWLLRPLVVLSLSLIHFAVMDYPPSRLPFAVFFVALIEWLTVNVLTVRKFYPADMFVDDWFPDRTSFDNKLTYGIVYLFSAGMFLYVLLTEFNMPGVIM